MLSISIRFIARIRQNLDAWRDGDIDHATFTEGQRDTWAAIGAAGKLVEAEVVAALHGGVLLAELGLLDDDDDGTMERPAVRRAVLRPEDRPYCGEIGRTAAGSPILTIAPAHPSSVQAEHRQISATIYELAAAMERCSQQLEVHWAISPDADNRQVVIELSGDHERELADELVANIMHRYGLQQPSQPSAVRPRATRSSRRSQ